MGCEAEVKEAAGAPELSIASAPCVCAPQPQSLRWRAGYRECTLGSLCKHTTQDGNMLRLKHAIIIFRTRLFLQSLLRQFIHSFDDDEGHCGATLQRLACGSPTHRSRKRERECLQFVRRHLVSILWGYSRSSNQIISVYIEIATNAT